MKKLCVYVYYIITIIYTSLLLSITSLLLSIRHYYYLLRHYYYLLRHYYYLLRHYNYLLRHYNYLLRHYNYLLRHYYYLLYHYHCLLHHYYLLISHNENTNFKRISKTYLQILSFIIVHFRIQNKNCCTHSQELAIWVKHKDTFYYRFESRFPLESLYPRGRSDRF